MYEDRTPKNGATLGSMREVEPRSIQGRDSQQDILALESGEQLPPTPTPPQCKKGDMGSAQGRRNANWGSEEISRGRFLSARERPQLPGERLQATVNKFWA